MEQDLVGPALAGTYAIHELPVKSSSKVTFRDGNYLVADCIVHQDRSIFHTQGQLKGFPDLFLVALLVPEKPASRKGTASLWGLVRNTVGESEFRQFPKYTDLAIEAWIFYYSVVDVDVMAVLHISLSHDWRLGIW